MIIAPNMVPVDQVLIQTVQFRIRLLHTSMVAHESGIFCTDLSVERKIWLLFHHGVLKYYILFTTKLNKVQLYSCSQLYYSTSIFTKSYSLSPTCIYKNRSFLPMQLFNNSITSRTLRCINLRTETL